MEIRHNLAEQLMPFWDWDIPSGDCYWSPAFYKLLSYDNGEIPATYDNWVERLHPDDAAKTLEKVDQALKGTSDYNVDFRLQCKNGIYKWVRARGLVVRDEEGNPIRMGGTYEVINDLYVEKQRMATILDAATDGFFDWDVNTNQQYLSPTFKAMFGYEDHELPNAPDSWMNLIDPDDLQTALANLKKHGKDPAHPYYQEVKYKHKLGHIVHVICRGVGLRDESGEITRLVGSHTDITKLKKAEQQLRDAYEQLNERTEELKATNEQLRQFAYAASHDLREPLRVVQGYAKLLESMELDLDPDAQSYMDWMVDATQRMSKMIDGLLVYSRLQNDEKFATVSMYSVYERAKASLRQQIIDSEAIINCSSNLSAVVGVKSQLERLVQNLLSNAIKFADPHRAPDIMFNVENQNGMTTFSVKDNGIGIKERHYERIFKLFKRLHPAGKYEGTGMGLAICQQIVERHEGNIWVESDYGKGSTFYFTLPTSK